MYPSDLASFWRKLVPRPQKSKSLKNEKNTLRYSHKEKVCKVSTKFDSDADSSSTEIENYEINKIIEPADSNMIFLNIQKVLNLDKNHVFIIKSKLK